MSLLDTASLLLTPNAYKEGKLYSVIPSDGSGDFTFTRATTATRVNSDGLVELVPYNLLQQSNTFNNAIWQLIGTPTITANYDTNPLTGENDAWRFQSSGNSQRIYQGLNNSFCTFSLYAKGSGIIRIRDSSSTHITTLTLTSSWQRFLIYIPASFTNVQISASSGGCDATIYGAQLVEGTNALPYQKTETRLNIPRIDYSLGGCPNILLEPQRTNYLPQSNTFSIGWAITGTGSSVGNSVSGPFSNLDGTSITLASGGLLYSSITPISSGVMSIYMRVPSGTVDLQLGDPLGSPYETKTLTTTWQRFSTVDTGSLGGLAVYNNPSQSGTTITIEVSAAQLEQGSYATSYIPTTSAIVTRNKDTTVEKDLTSFGIGNSYTLLFDLTMATEDSNKILFYLKNSAGADSFTFRNFSGILSVYDAIGLTYPLAALANESTKWAFRFDGVNYSLFRVSGGVAVKNTATLGTARNIGYLNSFNISGTKASLKLLAIEPSALTDAECEQFVIS
jgi:hypothetical protein